MNSCPIIIKGAGEMASGVAVRLYRAGFRHILLLECEAPLAVRRTVSFCEAVYDGSQSVEGIAAHLIRDAHDLQKAWDVGTLAVAVDPAWAWIARLQPQVVVDAIIAKRNLGTHCGEAPLVVALGPGFTAGQDCHAVVESQRGHDLGRVYAEGCAEPNTGIPGNIGGYTLERVLRAPEAGVVRVHKDIGSLVKVGDIVLSVCDVPVRTVIDGVVRGCIRHGLEVSAGVKIGDVDPRGREDYAYTVSEKARTLGGAVLEALCAHIFQRKKICNFA